MSPEGREKRAPVSVMIFTLNEEIHLPACLASLGWCDDVIVVDSYSTDGTEQIARDAGARLFQNKFEGFGTQRNWAIDNTSPKNKWVLILDADERVTAELADEMADVLGSTPPEVGAFRLKRRFYMWGRWLRYSSLYPTWVVRLIRIGRVRYVNRGHAETQEVNGTVAELKHDLVDENLKGMDEWFARQNRYSAKDAEHELQQESAPFRFADLVETDPLARRAAMKRIGGWIPGRPLFYFLYAYIFRLGFLDGRDGLIFCLMKSLYQVMVNVKKHDLRKRRPDR